MVRGVKEEEDRRRDGRPPDAVPWGADVTREEKEEENVTCRWSWQLLSGNVLLWKAVGQR